MASAFGKAAAPTPAIAEPSFSSLGFAALLALAALAQLDAVGNRLSETLPVALYPTLYGVAVLLAAMAWLGDRGTRLTGTPAHGARLAAAFFLWAVAAWMLSGANDSGREYLNGLAKAMGLLPLVLLLADTRERLAALVWTMVLAGAASAAIVYGDFLTGSRLVSTADAAVTAEYAGFARSAGGSDENPTTAAHMLLVSTMLLLGLLAAAGRLRPLLLAVALGCIGALALMAARSALLGFGAALLLLLFVVRRERAFPFLMLAVAAGTAAALMLAPWVLERMAALGDWSEDPTLARRATYLKVGVDLLQGSPIWGVGPGNYPLLFVGEEYRFLPGRPPVPRELHNTWLDVTVETGLVGFGLFLAAVAAALAACARALRSAALRPLALGLLCAAVALLAASLFMPNKDMRYLWLLLAALIQCGRLAAQQRRAAA